MVSCKFQKCKSTWLIEELTKYSSYDFEFIFRELYEEVYSIQWDKGHAFCKANLLSHSLIFNNLSLGNNSWKNKLLTTVFTLILS